MDSFSFGHFVLGAAIFWFAKGFWDLYLRTMELKKAKRTAKDEADWCSRYYELLTEFNDLLSRWNTLARRINAKGGEEFLKHGVMPGGQQRADTGLSDVDIKRLLSLCHPDKHGGKQLAQDMTHKLLQMRRNNQTFH